MKRLLSVIAPEVGAAIPNNMLIHDMADIGKLDGSRGAVTVNIAPTASASVVEKPHRRNPPRPSRCLEKPKE